MKKILFSLLFVFLFLPFINVHASTYVQPNVGLQINNNTNYQYSVTNSTTGSSYNIKVAVSESTPAYFILDTCVSANYTDFEITNSSCDNSCINNGKVLYYTIGNLGDCKINGYNGRHVLLQLQVRKYEIDPVSTYYIANSRIRFGGYSNYTSVVRIDNFYATDDDVLTQLANGQLQYNDLKNTINNLSSSITNNQNNNTNSIINNQNNNTTSIINQILSGTNATIEANKVCKQFDKNSIKFPNTYLYNGIVNTTSSTLGTTDFINIYGGELKQLSPYNSGGLTVACFYNVNKTFISCLTQNDVSSQSSINLPNNSYYVRFTINTNTNIPTWSICKDGNQALQDTQQEILDMDIGSSEKQLPSDSAFQDYENKENQLKDFINTADVSALDVTLDTNASTWVWDTLTSFIQSNALVFGMFIAILSIGVIKLALGR